VAACPARQGAVGFVGLALSVALLASSVVGG
jgi:hypothetical protein